jgi:hypothetical protein
MLIQRITNPVWLKMVLLCKTGQQVQKINIYHLWGRGGTSTGETPGTTEKLRPQKGTIIIDSNGVSYTT